MINFLILIAIYHKILVTRKRFSYSFVVFHTASVTLSYLLYESASSILVCFAQQQFSFSQFLITQTHLHASTSFPAQGGK